MSEMKRLGIEGLINATKDTAEKTVKTVGKVVSAVVGGYDSGMKPKKADKFKLKKKAKGTRSVVKPPKGKKP
tara:strand:+ start:2004 stop:2219 length:216 start_codon:yes stop_codon:yes gene_type:complete